MQPERPRLALRIGVTGHRTDRLAMLARKAGLDATSYTTRMADMFASIFTATQAACNEILLKPANRFGREPPLINVVVGAAYGADRIAAAVVHDRFIRPRDAASDTDASSARWRLESVLPAPLPLTAQAAFADYEAPAGQDDGAAYFEDWTQFLARCDSVTTLPASWRAGRGPDVRMSDRPDLADLFGPTERIAGNYRLSYAEAASFQLKRVDLLVAVWDREPSRGPGGVADIVLHGHAAGIPVILIDPVNLERPPAMLRSIVLGPDRTNIVGWSPEPIDVVLEAADCRDAAISDALTVLLEPGANAAHEKDELSLDDFLDERDNRARPLRLYDRFVRLLGTGHWPSAGWGSSRERRGDAGWSAWEKALDGDMACAGDLAILKRRYATASKLANDYASRYRSAFVLAFALAAVAAAFAVVGQVVDNHNRILKAWLVGGELVAIVWVICVIRLGRQRRYHLKYVEYRTLAETLYGLRFLFALGEAATMRETDLNRWSDWYLRSTIRELTLPNLALDATFQRRILTTVREYEIEPQINYHEGNARLMEGVEHRIHQIGSALFLCVFVSLILLLALWTMASPDEAPRGSAAHALNIILDVVTAILPTVGAALAGIRFMADFDGRAARSRETADALRRLGDRAEAARYSQQFSKTREILRDLAVTLSQDINHFHTNFSRRQLSLPS